MKNQFSQQSTISPLKKLLFGTIFFFFILVILESLLSFADLDKYDHEFMPKSSYPIFVKGKDKFADSYVTSSHFNEFINWQSFPQKKDTDTFRIFVIGGSAAYAWPNIDKFGFAGHLRRAFDTVMPGKVEIINAAGLSYGSHRVLDVLHDVLLFEPDLVIVFSGNNEYVERNVLPESRKSNAVIEKMGSLLGQTNTYRAVRMCLLKTLPGTFSTLKKPDITDIRSNPYFERGSLGRTTKIDHDVLNNYRSNLTVMKELLAGQHVKAIFCTIPVNVGGWVPKVGDPKFASENDANKWFDLYELKDKALHNNDIGLEAEYLEKMLAITPDDPGLRFNYGKVLWNLRKYAASYRELEKAKDLDLRPIRALSSFNKTVRTLVNDQQGIYLTDFETNFKELYFNQIADRLFLDYCHFTDLGYKIVARMLLPVIQKAMNVNLPLEQLESRIMADKTSLTKDNSQRASELFAMSMTMQNNGMLDETIEALKKVLAIMPEYNSALSNLATIYFKKGDFDEAKALYLKAIAISPDNIEALTSLGLISTNDNDYEKAVQYFQKAYMINSYSPAATLGLAYVAIQQGQPDNAKLYYEKTLELGRDSFLLRRGLGEAYLMLGDQENALRNWKIALKFSPYDQKTKALIEKYSQTN